MMKLADSKGTFLEINEIIKKASSQMLLLLFVFYSSLFSPLICHPL